VAFGSGSGAGKSTVLNLLIGFNEPAEGRLLIYGINMSNPNMQEYCVAVQTVSGWWA
jgi:ATP-binding cassette subfamily B protein